MQQAISYRDRNGFVMVQENSVYRFVTYAYAKEYDHLIQSGLYQKLVDKSLLIPHTEKTLSAAEKIKYYKVLEPELIPCMSFPYEWSANQWKDVVLSLLQINRICIEYGMIIKDATAFNLTFYNGRCIFFDTLSFDFYDDGQPWMAYRQFCESMLGPLTLMHFNSANWTKLMALSINGWELPFISRNLPLSSFFNATILMHIHWHSKYHNIKQEGLLKRNTFTKQKLLVLWSMLYKSISRWKMKEQPKIWSDYYDIGIVSSEYILDKTMIVTKWLSGIQPRRVTDIGANNGRISMIAALYANEVLAIESDHDCIDQLYCTIKRKNIQNITTIVADITQPTPGVGWNNEERAPLLKRLSCDCLLALALIHHLCISKNIPLFFIAELFAGITDKNLVIEFVPKSDPKIKQMLANREDIFEDYNEGQFLHCFQEYFVLRETHLCTSSERKLFLWTKK